MNGGRDDLKELQHKKSTKEREKKKSKVEFLMGEGKGEEGRRREEEGERKGRTGHTGKTTMDKKRWDR